MCIIGFFLAVPADCCDNYFSANTILWRVGKGEKGRESKKGEGRECEKRGMRELQSSLRRKKGFEAIHPTWGLYCIKIDCIRV